MNSRILQSEFYFHTSQRYELLAPNVYFGWDGNEMDLIGIRPSGYIDEIEIKISKSDYLADFKKRCQTNMSKTKHDAIKAGEMPCNYFSFLMPAELAEKCEVPDYAGLYAYYIDNAGCGRIKEIQKPKILHKNKISEKRKWELGRKMAFRFWREETKIITPPES